ncbi:MAG TPA: molybdopterin converting factor subunit 1 [Vicinamibacterales bacterium]|nr:molybdopterin converting factor subunit 1 [Vicinamibacterales bacterium]
MRVTVRLFARLREIAGQDAIERDVPAGSSLGDVWASLVEQWPAMRAFDSTVSGAVNEEYARMAREVRDGDEVAFLPPVSGG